MSYTSTHYNRRRTSRLGRAAVLSLSLLALFFANCGTSHEVYGDPSPEEVTDTSLSDTATEVEEVEESEVSIIDCRATEDVVRVSGELRHEGSVPSSARLWIVWQADADNPGMPLCFGEVLPLAFPARFEVINLSRGSSWDLQGVLSMAGFFPPMPVAGDYYGAVKNAELGGLVDDVADIVIDLEPWMQ